MCLLDTYFKKKTALNSTIYFVEGLQQCIHRDTPYFWSKPNSGEFVGVWFAFEDVNENNGKLEYYPFGHTINLNRYDFSNDNKLLFSSDLFAKYGEEV